MKLGADPAHDMTCRQQHACRQRGSSKVPTGALGGDARQCTPAPTTAGRGDWAAPAAPAHPTIKQLESCYPHAPCTPTLIKSSGPMPPVPRDDLPLLPSHLAKQLFRDTAHCTPGGESARHPSCLQRHTGASQCAERLHTPAGMAPACIACKTPQVHLYSRQACAPAQHSTAQHRGERCMCAAPLSPGFQMGVFTTCSAVGGVEVGGACYTERPLHPTQTHRPEETALPSPASCLFLYLPAYANLPEAPVPKPSHPPSLRVVGVNSQVFCVHL